MVLWHIATITTTQERDSHPAAATARAPRPGQNTATGQQSFGQFLHNALRAASEAAVPPR